MTLSTHPMSVQNVVCGTLGIFINIKENTYDIRSKIYG